ncbi:4-hydroxy-tetrahydrodipicolinate reductase [Flavobacteriaceae bacterium]|nr:4-hydroxy-tetrahydrodipicolinate reductase [Flavobacteriaceae bacterium]MDB2631365.1 4-hydroxy-tetrahydrodipicolinate reductase [Flavobacteriaceae bacterium]
MKIALLGYGKMGKVIEKIALERGHHVVLKIDKDDTNFDLSVADVAIDFSVPTAAVGNISAALNQNVPVISGTTGWLDNFEDIKSICEKTNGAFIYASNFSLGVNLFFELNKVLAKLITPFKEYNVQIEEIHHTQKQDAPSGTAITLAEGIAKESNYEGWTLSPKTEPQKIKIEAKRIENVPGTHTINYTSEVDTLEITHTAHNRNGFALGAVVAAEWIIGKKGIFTMKDVLNIK